MERPELEVPELRVKNPYIIEEIEKPKVKNEVEADLLYKSPRLFRKSIIYKTLKLFGAQNEQEPKLNRTLKEK